MRRLQQILYAALEVAYFEAFDLYGQTSFLRSKLDFHNDRHKHYHPGSVSGIG